MVGSLLGINVSIHMSIILGSSMWFFKLSLLIFFCKNLSASPKAI